jgi:hypothetical protein
MIDSPKTPNELPVKLPRLEHAFKIAFMRSLNDVLLPRGRVQPSFNPQTPPAARPAYISSPVYQISPTLTVLISLESKCT